TPQFNAVSPGFPQLDYGPLILRTFVGAIVAPLPFAVRRRKLNPTSNGGCASQHHCQKEKPDHTSRTPRLSYTRHPPPLESPMSTVAAVISWRLVWRHHHNLALP